MEEFAVVGLVGFLGLILAFLGRSLLKMYEKLWNNNNSNSQNPEEMYGIVADAFNEALKKREDRMRKRVPKETTNEESNIPVTPEVDQKEAQINKLWEYYKEMTGED